MSVYHHLVDARAAARARDWAEVEACVVEALATAEAEGRPLTEAEAALARGIAHRARTGGRPDVADLLAEAIEAAAAAQVAREEEERRRAEERRRQEYEAARRRDRERRQDEAAREARRQFWDAWLASRNLDRMVPVEGDARGWAPLWDCPSRPGTVPAEDPVVLRRWYTHRNRNRALIVARWADGTARWYYRTWFGRQSALVELSGYELAERLHEAGLVSALDWDRACARSRAVQQAAREAVE